MEGGFGMIKDEIGMDVIDVDVAIKNIADWSELDRKLENKSVSEKKYYCRICARWDFQNNADISDIKKYAEHTKLISETPIMDLRDKRKQTDWCLNFQCFRCLSGYSIFVDVLDYKPEVKKNASNKS